MGFSPTNIVQFVCDNCGATANFDRNTPGQYAPVGWYVLEVWNMPNHLTFDKFDCLSHYVLNPPPVGSVNSPGDNTVVSDTEPPVAP